MEPIERAALRATRRCALAIPYRGRPWGPLGCSFVGNASALDSVARGIPGAVTVVASQPR